MSGSCCGAMPKYDFGICRCCQLVDGDTSLKTVSYCELCTVYLCDPCRENPIKRIKAFGKQFFENITQTTNTKTQ